jgi:PhnB protein
LQALSKTPRPFDYSIRKRFKLPTIRLFLKETAMLQPIPYLFFNGNCTDAVRFYERVLGARTEALIRFADMDQQCSSEHGELIAHARLVLEGGGLLYAGDCHPSIPYEGIKAVSLALNYDTVEQAQNVFAALSDGGNVSMPMQGSMWAKAFGMTTDRYGVDWMVNGELKPM